jgi:peptidoglycan/xylan/chitin deacetylase (PgdA/CDA1 family)
MAVPGVRLRRMALPAAMGLVILALSCAVGVVGNAQSSAAVERRSAQPVEPVDLQATRVLFADPDADSGPDTTIGGLHSYRGTGPPPERVDCTEVKCVAITFDDGPGRQTSELLGMLARYDARATWFALGEVVTDSPSTLAQIARAGHEVGNHSWSHPELTRLRTSSIESQIERTTRTIDAATGQEPSLVRPPYGSISGRVDRVLGRLGSPVILWDVDSLDWKSLNSSRVYSRVMRQVRPGSIVLLHDIHPSTVAAVPRILRALAARGYAFVTVSDLFDDDLAPGEVYTDRTGDYHPR